MGETVGKLEDEGAEKGPLFLLVISGRIFTDRRDLRLQLISFLQPSNAISGGACNSYGRGNSARFLGTDYSICPSNPEVNRYFLQFTSHWISSVFNSCSSSHWTYRYVFTRKKLEYLCLKYIAFCFVKCKLIFTIWKIHFSNWSP